MASDLIKIDLPDDDINRKRAKVFATIITILIFCIPLYYIMPYAVSLVHSINDLISGLIKGGAMVLACYILYVIYKTFRGSFGHWLEKKAWSALDAVIATNPTQSMRIEISKAVETKKEQTQGLAEMLVLVDDMEQRQAAQSKEAMNQLSAASSFQQKAQEATSPNEKDEYKRKEVLARNAAQYKKDSNDRMKDSLFQYKTYAERMKKLADSMEFFITDQKNLADQIEQDWLYSRKMKKSATASMKNADLFINDNSIYMRASRIAKEQIKNNIAVVEAAFQNSKQIVDKADLEKGILDIQSQQLLSEYQAGEFDQVIEMMNKKSDFGELKNRARIELETGQSSTANANQKYIPEFKDIYKQK